MESYIVITYIKTEEKLANSLTNPLSTTYLNLIIKQVIYIFDYLSNVGKNELFELALMILQNVVGNLLSPL